MTDEPKFAPEVEKKISEATTSEEIRDLATTQPRDEKTGQFIAKDGTAPAAKVEPKTEEAKPADEPTVVKDTFLIGGKPFEFTGDDAADILKQVKVAQQTWELAQKKEVVEKPEPKGATPEELASLQLKIAAGDPNAMIEYMEKSGALDRYLEKKGIRPEEIKEVLESNASQKTVTAWDGAVKDFLAESDWPGGTQNEKLLKYKLAELKDDKGNPLAYSPSKASLQAAYESLKSENMLFAREEPSGETRQETAKPTGQAAATTTTVAPKKAPQGSTVFGTSQESGTRRAASTTAKNTPQIADTDTPQEIMAKFKEAALANGQSPDDLLRGSYSGKA
jgi:hypothetical protein